MTNSDLIPEHMAMDVPHLDLSSQLTSSLTATAHSVILMTAIYQNETVASTVFLRLYHEPGRPDLVLRLA